MSDQSLQGALNELRADLDRSYPDRAQYDVPSTVIDRLDAMLAAHPAEDAPSAASAWSAGHRIGWEHHQDGGYGNDYWDDPTPNPYNTVCNTVVEVRDARPLVDAEADAGPCCLQVGTCELLNVAISSSSAARPMPTREQIERAMREQLVRSNFSDNLHEPMRSQVIDQWVEVLAGSMVLLLNGAES
jgi:hypothetical protein